MGNGRHGGRASPTLGSDGGPGSGPRSGGEHGYPHNIPGYGPGEKNYGKDPGHQPYEAGKNDHLYGGKSNRARAREGQPTQDAGRGRWGGRASPHGRDVGESYQGETIEGFTPTAGMRGSLTKENDGEGLPKFTPKEGGSLNKEALGEMRNSGNAKPLGDPKHVQSGFNPSKSGGRGAGESGSKSPGEPGVGGKQFTSKGSPGNMVSAKDWRR